MHQLLAGVAMLIIGDSHLSLPGYLVSSLQDRLVAEGASVATYSACGAPAGAWVVPQQVACRTAERVQSGPILVHNGQKARSWSIDSLIAKHRPNLIVVELGDTMAGYGGDLPREWMAEQVTALTARIRAANIPCIWVGPHWGTEGGQYGKTYARATEAAALLKQITAPCHYLDSTALSAPGAWPTFDGLHYTTEGYRLWGEALAKAIPQMAVTIRVVENPPPARK